MDLIDPYVAPDPVRRAKPRDPNVIKLEAQVALLRETLRTSAEMMKGRDIAHVIVDLARPNVGLRQHILRVLKDTR